MDNFIKLGQQAYQKYSDSQPHHEKTGGIGGNDVNVMGGAHLNRPAGGQMIDTDGDGIPDFEQAAAHASKHSGSSGDSSMFNTAVSFLKSHAQNQHDDDDDIDEHKVTEAHDRAYNQKQGGPLDAKSMGAAAALQAFKKFSNQDDNAKNSKNDKDIQSKLLGMAMAQAAELFDSKGGAASGQKQDAVNSAGKMVMKLLMKQKLQQMGGGGAGGGGGLGGLASMLGKFA